MERRFALRYEELMADAEVTPEALEGVLDRLEDFVRPFAASLEYAAQRSHLEEYISSTAQWTIQIYATFVLGFWRGNRLRYRYAVGASRRGSDCAG